MPEIKVEDLIAVYESEIGRLTGELIKTKLSYEAQIKEITESFAAERTKETNAE